MPEDKRAIFTKVANTLKETSPEVDMLESDEKIERELLKAARIRGISADTLSQAATGVWSKTYTEHDLVK